MRFISPDTPLLRTAATAFSLAGIIIGIVGIDGAVTHVTAAPIIHEVFYDAVGSDGSEVFTELFGDPGATLDGWSLVGINGGTGLSYRTIDLTGAVFPSDGLLVIAGSSANPALALERDFVGNVDWQNGPDAVRLLDPMMSLVDALQYGDAGAFNSGLGAPALDADAGSSLSRNMFGTNTGDNLADFVVATPSPGIGPSVTPPTSVPEPSTLVLFGIGVATALVGRRRERKRSWGWG